MHNGYYLSPVDNFLQGNDWKRDPGVGNGSYFRRVPGYSLLYLTSRIVTPDKKSGLRLLIIFQIALYLASIYWLFNSLSTLLINKYIKLMLLLIYTITPWFNIYPFFTITESISGYLVLGVVNYCIVAYKSEVVSIKFRNYLICVTLISFLLLTRPVTGILGIFILIFLFYDYYIKHSFKIFALKCMALGLVPLLFVGVWTIRNYAITEEIVVLEKASHPESLDQLKPGMRSIWNLTKSWGEYHFWENEMYLWGAVEGGDTVCSTQINNIIKKWPNDIVAQIGEERLRKGLEMHRDVLIGYKPYFDNLTPMPSSYGDAELEQVKYFENLKTEFVKNNWFTNYIASPFIYLKHIVLHSNTSGVTFLQKEFRTITILNFYRYLLAAIHTILYLGLFLSFVYYISKPDWTNPHRLAFQVVPLLFVFFFVVIHREIEQRYMLPILSLIMINLGNFLNSILTFTRLEVNPK